MESTQVMSEHFHRVKYQVCGFCHSSGRMDLHNTPRKDTQPCCLHGTKENCELDSSLLSHRKDQRRLKDSIKESKKEPPVQTGWCETPKLKKKDVSLRRRLLMSQPFSDGSKKSITTPGKVSRDHISNGDNNSLDSPDFSPTGPLTYSTLKADNLHFSCRERRLMFCQAITSTLETGRSGGHMPFQNHAADALAEPELDESIIAGLPGSPQTNELLADDPFQSPVRVDKHFQRQNILDTPCLTPTSAAEDSGFSSLGLDKSHNNSVDHDGSFQELVLLLSSGSKEKRRLFLERQRRLSTLREGGSQSEDVPRDQRVVQDEPAAHVSRDSAFLDGTPLSDTTLKMQDLSLTPALQVVHAISRRSTRALQQQTSLEELLCVSEEDGPIRACLPLSGLIGRKMGLDKVDIITELKVRNLRHVLAIIVSLLSAADVYRFGQVSDDWSDVISEDRKASQRRRCHIRELKTALVAGRTVHVTDADTRLAVSCRSALSSVQAQARTPHTHTPSTPTQHTEPQLSTKRMEFLQVAKTLFSDEYLKPCPRCQHPARCHTLRGEGLCSWSDCSFQFCTSCLCAFHGSKDCAHLSAKRRSRRDVLPGSAQSKRNVRRL